MDTIKRLLLLPLVFAGLFLLFWRGHPAPPHPAVVSVRVSQPFAATKKRALASRLKGRQFMALNSLGYKTVSPQPGTSSAIGSYVPANGANATAGGTTQFTNGTDFLTYAPSIGWLLSLSPNLTNPGANTYYYNPVRDPLNFPLAGWVTSNGTNPAPTFSVIPLRNPLVLDAGQTRELTSADGLNVAGQFYLGGSLVADFVNAAKVTVNYTVIANVDTFIILDTTSGTLTATLPDPTSYNGPTVGVGCTGTGGTSGTVATAGTSKTITGSTTVAQGSTRLYTRLSDGSGWWQH